MKTGRARKKRQPKAEPEKPAPTEPPSKPPVPEPEAPASADPPSKPPVPKPETPPPPKPSHKPQPQKPSTVKPAQSAVGIRARKSPSIGCIVAPIALFVVGIFLIILLFGGKKADEWIKVTRASGEWTTTTTIFGPQVQVDERWEADCVSQPNGAVRAGTCILKDTDTYQDKVVDDYEEYVYNIYYEELEQTTYQVRGTEFVVTALGRDDWWEDNLHYSRVEELDKDSCEYTDYTVWVDDPQDKTQEIEVYLAECEVWDHIVVEERLYDQKDWCQCDITTLVQLGQQSERGSGFNIRWPSPTVPQGGRAEQAFKGQVTFLGDDYTYTTTTDDLAKYQDYLQDQYYIGIRSGKPSAISKNPGK